MLKACFAVSPAAAKAENPTARISSTGHLYMPEQTKQMDSAFAEAHMAQAAQSPIPSSACESRPGQTEPVPVAEEPIRVFQVQHDLLLVGGKACARCAPPPPPATKEKCRRCRLRCRCPLGMTEPTRRLLAVRLGEPLPAVQAGARAHRPDPRAHPPPFRADRSGTRAFTKGPLRLTGGEPLGTSGGGC